jgi:hypothetical protein
MLPCATAARRVPCCLACRLPFLFKTFNYGAYNVQFQCQPASWTQLRQSVVKPGIRWTRGISSFKGWKGAYAPPQVPKVNGQYQCNHGIPGSGSTVRQQYIWVVKYLTSQGFLVQLDFHSQAKTPSHDLYIPWVSAPRPPFPSRCARCRLPLPDGCRYY